MSSSNSAEKQHHDRPTEIIDAFVDTSEIAASHDINEGAFLRRLDLKLLPPLGFLYLLSFLDRSNVGNARVEGLAADLHMTGDQYLTGLTLFFIGYVLFEVPSNIVLKLWTPRMWLPTLTIFWGIVATMLGVIQTKNDFFGVRFLLGVSECGLFPGIVYYLSLYCKRNERQYRIALFFSAAALAGSFGGVLAWGIAHMDGVGNYRGWRWIFIIEGLFTVVVGFAAYLFIHNYPATAKFLTPNERTFILARLEADSDATRTEKFAWPEVRKAFLDIKVYLYCFGFHTMSLPLYTLSLFFPSIIKDLGYTAAQAQLLTVPPYAFAFFTTVGIAILSERTHMRAPYIIGSSAFAIIGYIILIAEHTPGVSYTGTFFAAGGIYPAVALVLAWPANNVSGQTKRAVANAMQIMIGNLGAVLGTQLYRTETAPRYFLGHGFALGYLVANIVVVTTLWLVLKKENAKRDRLLREKDSAVVGVAGREKNTDSELSDEERRGSVAPGSVEDFKGDDDVRWRFMI